MSDEIKEILNKCTPYLFGDEVDILSDYITNLQQENERLEEENKRIFSKVNDDKLLISNAMNYAEAQDYKSRVEKAVEYIKSLYIFGLRGGKTLLNKILNELLEILQGGKDGRE